MPCVAGPRGIYALRFDSDKIVCVCGVFKKKKVEFACSSIHIYTYTRGLTIIAGISNEKYSLTGYINT